jgi:hypothetical protein
MVFPEGPQQSGGSGVGTFSGPSRLSKVASVRFITSYSSGLYYNGELVDGYEDGKYWLYLTSKTDDNVQNIRKLTVPANSDSFSREVFEKLETTDVWKNVLKPAADAESAVHWEKVGYNPHRRKKN